MSLHLASAFRTMPAEGADLTTLRRGAMRLFSLARRLRPNGMLPAMRRSMGGSARLSAADLRDAGLRADQIGQAPIWGHGGIMWRP